MINKNALQDLLQKFNSLEKESFAPPAPPPPDPNMPPPGMDPNAQGGMPPQGMDPAMMAAMMGGMQGAPQGAPPPPGMDPAAQAGMPPPGDAGVQLPPPQEAPMPAAPGPDIAGLQAQIAQLQQQVQGLTDMLAAKDAPFTDEAKKALQPAAPAPETIQPEEQQLPLPSAEEKTAAAKSRWEDHKRIYHDKQAASRSGLLKDLQRMNLIKA